jgi:F-type H+-transporting ATPase subunit epsilon
MFTKSFQVGIYSRDKVVYEGKAVSLTVPSVWGYLGVLADHAPIVAKLVKGKITVRSPEGSTTAIDLSSGGFLEVLQNQATILLSQ